MALCILIVCGWCLLQSLWGRLLNVITRYKTNWRQIAVIQNCSSLSSLIALSMIYQFWLISIGDSTVGRSSLSRKEKSLDLKISDSLIHYSCSRYFSDVGVDFFSRLVNLSSGARVKLQLWDTAGQESWLRTGSDPTPSPTIYCNSVGGVLAYDVCNMDSFKHIPVWLQEAKIYIKPHQATFILLGCKTDLAVGNNRGDRGAGSEPGKLPQHHLHGDLGQAGHQCGGGVHCDIRWDLQQTRQRRISRVGIKAGYFEATDIGQRGRVERSLPGGLMEAEQSVFSGWGLAERGWWNHEDKLYKNTVFHFILAQYLGEVVQMVGLEHQEVRVEQVKMRRCCAWPSWCQPSGGSLHLFGAGKTVHQYCHLTIQNTDFREAEVWTPAWHGPEEGGWGDLDSDPRKL